MATPVFVGAGAGAIATTGTLSLTKTSCTAGNFIAVHLLARGATEDWGDTTHPNISTLSGGADDVTGVCTGQPLGNPTNGGRASLFVGRVTANGTCTSNFTVGASGEDLLGRIYEFSGVSTGTTVATVCEQSTGTFNSANGTGTTVDPTAFGSDFITLGGLRLGCCFISQDVAQAIGDLTTETGGIDFTEAVAEYQEGTGALGTLQLQTASIAGAGTYDPGVVTTGSSSQWGVIITSLIPAPDAAPYLRTVGSPLRY